jgi:hypothetical protein
MPRAERLSSRLDTLLEAIFNAPSDPFTLYWDIAAQIRRDQHAQVQTKIRKTLRQKGEIGAESAVLLACVLHLTGFPAHRILHFLSLYIPGGIRLSLFELAVSAIFLGEPPIPATLLYDLTQYTYLEKRLLVRRSMEISDTLKASLSPAVLLFLYLLSLRDDLSNENIQLIALIMKNCFPAQEVRTRIGGASLEEYGEIAHAWKNAEGRSLDLEISQGSRSEKRARPFDRDSASFFLDRYFSDEALSEMRASAPPPPPRMPQRPVPAHSRVRVQREEETAAPPSVPNAPPPNVRMKSRETVRRTGPREAAPVSGQEMRAPRKRAAGGRRPTPMRRREAGTEKAEAEPHRTVQRLPVRRRSESELLRRLLLLAPTVCAAVVMALVLFLMPAGRGHYAIPPASPVEAGVPALPAPMTPASPPQPSPSVLPSPSPLPATTTYVVRPGDSLWKIFTSMSPPDSDRRGWMDFLSKMQSLNGLGDPDRLQPGKILTLSAKE